MKQLIAIAVGGALGAVLRFAISTIVQTYSKADFPWGTISVNLIGCFLIGLLFQLFEILPLIQTQRAFLFTGLLGAFTTFSTYGLDTVRLIQAGHLTLALGKILISNGFGILLVFGGMSIGRFLLNHFSPLN